MDSERKPFVINPLQLIGPSEESEDIAYSLSETLNPYFIYKRLMVIQLKALNKTRQSIARSEPIYFRYYNEDGEIYYFPVVALQTWPESNDGKKIICTIWYGSGNISF